MRHTNTGATLKAAHTAGKETQSRNIRRFVGGVEEGLQAKTNTKKWSILGKVLFKRGDEAADLEIMHGGSERADTGEDEFLSGENVRGGLCPADVVTEDAESVFEAADVASAIVEDGDKGGFWGGNRGARMWACGSTRCDSRRGEDGVVWAEKWSEGLEG